MDLKSQAFGEGIKELSKLRSSYRVFEREKG